MNTDNQSSTLVVRSRLRRRWLIRLCLAVAGIAWVIFFALPRLLNMPPLLPDADDPDLGLAPPSSPNDRSREMAAALKRLSFPSDVTVPAFIPYADCVERDEQSKPAKTKRAPSASGRNVPLSPWNGLVGEWNPSKRLLLSGIVAYMDRTDIRQALDTIAALSDSPFCLTHRDGILPRSKPPYLGYAHPPKLATLLFTLRARREMAERGDFGKATAEIETIVRLSAPRHSSRTTDRLISGYRFRTHDAMIEVLRWLGEFDIPASAKCDFARWLSTYPYDWREEWRLGLRGERVWIEQHVDRLFTKDASGNGWFVYYRQRKHPVLRALNLFSPLFDDRTAVIRRLNGQFDQLALLAEKPLIETIRVRAAACATLNAGASVSDAVFPPTSDQGWSFDHADKLLNAHGVFAHYAHRMVDYVQTRTDLDATAIHLALSAYKDEQGEYPDDLGELVPQYLDALPIDPCGKGPYRYRCDKKRGPVVYSVGLDGADGGGVAEDSSPQGSQWDIVYVLKKRGKPDVEWLNVLSTSPTTGRIDADSD